MSRTAAVPFDWLISASQFVVGKGVESRVWDETFRGPSTALCSAQDDGPAFG